MRRSFTIALAVVILGAVSALAVTIGPSLWLTFTYPEITPGQVTVLERCSRSGDRVYVARSFEGYISVAVVPQGCPVAAVTPVRSR